MKYESIVAQVWLEKKPIYLDTETTGLGQDAEICDLAIVDWDGSVLLNTLVKPANPIPPEATAIHGIRNADVATAPSFTEVLPELHRLQADRVLLIYNTDYDLRLLKQSAQQAGCQKEYNPQPVKVRCVMKLYADYYGEWNEYHQNNRWQSLSAAAHQCNLPIPDDLHRALADAQLTRLVLNCVAKGL